LRRAIGFVVYSRRIELERGLRGIDGNRGRSSLYEGLEGFLVSRWYIGKRLQSSSYVGLGELASSIFSSVRIAGFSINTVVGDDVLHSLGHESSFTSHVSFRSRAIYQVLFRERYEFASGDLMASFSRSSSRERPARSTLSLILDSRNSSLGSPIPRRGRSSRWDINRGRFVFVSSGYFKSKVDRSEFFVREVSHMVHGQLDSIVLSVELIDEDLIGLECGKSVLEFIVVVGFGVSLHPLNEKGLVFLFSSESKSTGEEESKNDEGFHG
jgi:hypothetical protein